MAYFTRQHLELALPYLADHTVVFLVTVLAMMKANIAIGLERGGQRFGSQQEHALMREYFSPPGRTVERPFYLPFGPNRNGIDRWKPFNHGGTSFERMRNSRAKLLTPTDEPDGVGYHFNADFRQEMLAAHRSHIGAIPLSIHYLAAWMYRDVDIESHQQAIERFQNEFNLAAYDPSGELFSTAIVPVLAAIPLAETPIPEVMYDGLIDAQTNYEPEVLDPTAIRGDLVGADAELYEEDEAPEQAGAIGPGTWEIQVEALANALIPLQGMSEPALQALAALRAGMHVILTGPPGCGKTDLAQRICNAAGFQNWRATATDSWTTFETVGGYFPKVSQGVERLEFQPGVVTAAMKAERVLIIDEINRADIDKAFGELFTLLSGADVDLPYVAISADGTEHRIKLTTRTPDVSPASIHKPSWWRIIGAMNDSDKASLKRLSFAFMRRFAFVSVPIPSEEIYRTLIRDAGVDIDAQHSTFVESLESLFASRDGLARIGIPMGFAIPQSMIAQALSEARLDPARSTSALLASAINLYLVPQLQGRADLHEQFLAVVTPLVNADDVHRIQQELGNWTGFIG